LTDAGATPCGLAARDVLRLEAAYPLYGHELDDKHTPAESGTGWATRIAKEGFIGSDALILQRRAGIKDVLIGLAVVDPPNAIVRDGHPIFAADGETAVGAITSGTLSPTLGKGIAMARVARQYSKLGLSLIVQVRDRQVVAEVVKVPFYRNGV
jgi:aminomethyltransferase